MWFPPHGIFRYLTHSFWLNYILFNLKAGPHMVFVNEILCAIWYHLFNLKNVKNTHGRKLILVINTPPRVFFTFLKLCKCCICITNDLIVDPEEIKRLGKRFRKLDIDNSGTLSIEEFMSLPELQQNPLVQRVIEIFDQDGNKEIDFKGEKLIS